MLGWRDLGKSSLRMTFAERPEEVRCSVNVRTELGLEEAGRLTVFQSILVILKQQQQFSEQVFC